MKDSFIKLLDEFKGNAPYNYLGQGNPDSSILIIGREHGFTKESDAYRLEVLGNHDQWLKITKGEGFSELGYDPMTCFTQRRQEFRHGDTSPTWYVYQKIVNVVYPHEMQAGETAPLLDFFKYSFITEFSTASRPNNNNNNEDDIIATQESINKRTPLLSAEFYKSFPLVILACGRYFDDYGINIERMFDVKWKGETDFVKLGDGKRVWLNVHYSPDYKRVVVHTCQASYIARRKEQDYQPFLDFIAHLSSLPQD